MMLIVHQPMDSDKGDADDPDAAEQYEAFLLVGSHTPYAIFYPPQRHLR